MAVDSLNGDGDNGQRWGRVLVLYTGLEGCLQTGQEEDALVDDVIGGYVSQDSFFMTLAKL